jgi:hypothetical protein
MPASSFEYDDQKLMAANVTSGYNYRKIAGTEELSKHALGRAFDVNPRLNPYVHKMDDQIVIDPPGAVWRPEEPGTLRKNHELVQFLENRGWIWGGNWTLESDGKQDHHHFEKK